MTPSEPIRDVFAGLEGFQIPGGCDDCDALQTLEEVSAGVTVLTVHHDESCPWWNERRTPKDEP